MYKHSRHSDCRRRVVCILNIVAGLLIQLSVTSSVRPSGLGGVPPKASKHRLRTTFKVPYKPRRWESTICKAKLRLWSAMSVLMFALNKHIHTAILFTWNDYKTIFLPVVMFAHAAVPVHAAQISLQCCIWVWMHLLMCNISNQARNWQEDIINRPWRPLPSGRISERQAARLRYATIGICVLWSMTYGAKLVGATLLLVAITFLYDEGGLAGHSLGKNICNIGGYVAFELGAVRILGNGQELDIMITWAVSISGLIIFSTIHAQDFADIDGDSAIGRRTFPICAPELSRIVTCVLLCLWSIFVGWFWRIGPVAHSVVILTGSYVGLRYYLQRTNIADQQSYRLFNVWLLLVHILPLHYRTGAFSM